MPAADRHRVKVRGLRIPDDLWEALKRQAADESTTVTDIVLRAIRRYLEL